MSLARLSGPLVGWQPGIIFTSGRTAAVLHSIRPPGTGRGALCYADRQHRSPKGNVMSGAPGPKNLDDAGDDIISAYERYRAELPQKVIAAALRATAENDDGASEIELLTNMWKAVDAYIGWCHKQTFPPAAGTYEAAKGIIERLLFIQSMQGDG
jgi:hypothetical protein